MACRVRTLRVGPLPRNCSPIQHSRACRAKGGGGGGGECPPISLNDITINATVGVPYSSQAFAVGGTAPYAYVLTGGALPDGVALDPDTGDVTGTPTTAGTFNFTISVTDANNCPGQADYEVLIAEAPPYPETITVHITGPGGRDQSVVCAYAGQVEVAGHPGFYEASWSGSTNTPFFCSVEVQSNVNGFFVLFPAGTAGFWVNILTPLNPGNGGLWYTDSGYPDPIGQTYVSGLGTIDLVEVLV